MTKPDLTDPSGTRGVTLSNPDLAFARLGRSTVTSLDVLTPQLNLLAGGQVDGAKLGVRVQNGATQFLQRFALRPHRGYDAAAAMRFALEHQNPFVTGPLIGKADGPSPADTFSLLTVSDPGVLLWAVKPAEEGIEHGIVARRWNVTNQPAAATLMLTSDLISAARVTHIETDLESLPLAPGGGLPVTFARQQIATFRQRQN